MDYLPNKHPRRGTRGRPARRVRGIWNGQEFPHERGSSYRIHQGTFSLPFLNHRATLWWSTRPSRTLKMPLKTWKAARFWASKSMPTGPLLKTRVLRTVFDDKNKNNNNNMSSTISTSYSSASALSFLWCFLATRPYPLDFPHINHPTGRPPP